jgi:hypothetical protein
MFQKTLAQKFWIPWTLWKTYLICLTQNFVPMKLKELLPEKCSYIYSFLTSLFADVLFLMADTWEMFPFLWWIYVNPIILSITLNTNQFCCDTAVQLLPLRFHIHDVLYSNFWLSWCKFCFDFPQSFQEYARIMPQTMPVLPSFTSFPNSLLAPHPTIQHYNSLRQWPPAEPIFHPGDRSRIFLQNFGTHLPNYMVSFPKKLIFIFTAMNTLDPALLHYLYISHKNSIALNYSKCERLLGKNVEEGP